MTLPGPPPPGHPAFGYPPPYPPPYRPPASIKTFGILNLVFAGLGAIGLLFTWGMYFGGMRFGPRNPVVEIAHHSPTYMSFLKWSILLSVLGILALAASGIGLLGMKLWGRKLAIVYALYGVGSAVVGLVMTQVYVLGPLSETHSAVAGAGSAGGYMGGILGIVYPVILLVFMMKRNVVLALTRASEPPVPPARVV